MRPIVSVSLAAAAAALAAAVTTAGPGCAVDPGREHARGRDGVRPNVATDFNPEVDAPRISDTAYVYPDAVVIGSVELGARVLVGPHAFVRGDEGQHIRVGDESNVQDCAGIHALESVELHEGEWRSLPGRLFTAKGERVGMERHGDAARLTKRDLFAVWVGSRVSIAHQALVHGPAWVGDDTFIGMQAQVFNAKVGPGCVIAPRALVIGVDVPPGRLAPPGALVLDQAAADALPPVAGSTYEGLNRAVVHVNVELAEKYLAAERGERFLAR